MSFSFAGWLKNTKSNSRGTWRHQPRSAARAMRSTRLSLEPLEDRVTPASLTPLASFKVATGYTPLAGLVRDGDGNLFGTTYNGGAYGKGTVFEVAAGSGAVTALASFNGAAYPAAGLVRDNSGNLFGTSTAGGAYNSGTVFEMAAGSGAITTLASFNGTNGANPVAGLVRDGSGNLFGTTKSGGAYAAGTVFEVAAGSGTITDLASFNKTNGGHPAAGLVIDGSGNLFGTSAAGGAYNSGTVFEVAAGSGAITTLASFNGTNGATPAAGLVFDGSGNLFGTTQLGGAYATGTVFEVAAGSGTITALASFNKTNGANPVAGLVIDSSGNLLGTTRNGGAYDSGTVFEVVAGSGTITDLASFTGTNGTNPVAGLATDGYGNAFGTTSGGVYGSGTVFEVTGIDPPTVTPSGAYLPDNAATITIAGAGFSPTAANNSVVFNLGAAGTVTTASANSLTVTFTTKPTIAWILTAVVTSNGVSCGDPVQVATVTPVVTPSTALLAFKAPQITIDGFGFDPNTVNNTVTFNDGAVGSVTAASPTALTVTFSAQPTTAGSLTAIVTTNGVSSGAAVQVATASVVTLTGLTIPAAGSEGSPVALSATATDPVSALTYTWTVTRPNGTTLTTLSGASTSFTPPDNGSYGVSLSVSDSAGGSISVRPATGVIGWWRGEGNANDTVGGNNGTLHGGVTFAAGKVGQAFSLDGATGEVRLPNNFLPYPITGTSTTPLSFETWFRTSTGGVILGQSVGGGYVPAVYVGTDGRLRAEMFWGGSASPIASAGPVNDGQWHHVAVAYDGAAETVYLDGAAVGTTALTQTGYGASYEYHLGMGLAHGWPAAPSGTGFYFFGGLIDEPTFYNRALSGTDVQAIVNAGSGGKVLPVAVANVAPTPALSGPSTGLSTQVLTFTASATDPSPVDQAVGFNYAINWGDGQTSLKSRARGSSAFTHVFTTDGTYTVYTVTLTVTDKDGGASTITRTVTPLPVTSDNLQTVIAQQGSITTRETNNTQAQTLVNAVNGLFAQATPVTVTMNLGSGSYTDTSGSPHAGITLAIAGSGGTTTIVGHSPALQISGGTVIVSDLTLVTDTNSPTLVVTGGNVTLRNVTIEESSTSRQAALWITGGRVDLGTADSPGGNTFDVNGRGELIHNSGANAVSALGNTFEADGVTIASPYRVKDRIFDALNEDGGGLVSYVANNVYVTPKSGSIQRGVEAVAAGGTVNVEASHDDEGDSYEDYNAGSKLLTIAFESGPVLTQQADALNPKLRTLVVHGTPGNDTILFTPGEEEHDGGVQVRVNDVAPGTFSPTGRLIAYGGAGINDIRVSDDVSLPAWLYGGAGNNRLQGGGGNNVLVGGAGKNVLIGGEGRDLMIGGSGASTLKGQGGDDLLIAGTTAFDANEAALSAVMAEWTSGRDYATRVANLSGIGTGPRDNGNYFLMASGPNATVFDNGAVDVLNGGSGMDWFFANLSQDVIHGRRDSEIVENL